MLIRKNAQDEIFNYILEQIEKTVREKDVRDILVLTPFIYKKYVIKFVNFINKLRNLYGDINVTVVTRPSIFVANPRVHEESIRILRESNTVVCTPYSFKFHAKAIILGTRYVLAGSVNPLAPSQEEVLFTMPIIKLIENPISVATIIKVLTTAWCGTN